VAAFKGVTYMESTEFCGQLCHSVMKPEYTAYKRSPHAHVACVDCHIGEGADWFVRSKLSGLRQVWATFTGNFSRPIPTPIHHLRPARETCQHCHWPAQLHGSRLRVHHSYKNDLKNSQVTSVVRLNVGGINRRTGRYEGIHWHVAPDVRIEYEAMDGKRKVIGKVTKTEKGKTTVYLPSKRTGQVAERRVMDCVDCHNRPTHIYDGSPEGAVDRSLSLGKLDPALPFLRRQAVALLRKNVVPEQAAGRFSRELRKYYGEHYPEVARARKQSIDKAGLELGWIYRRNIYPELKIGWNTYPSHLGHRQTTVGCFRCHDDEHVAQRAQRRSPARERSGARNTSQGASKETIPQDCDLCHEVMAEEEARPDVPPGILRLGHM